MADNCNDILRDGVYDITSMAKTESFSHDLKKFFTSEEFKQFMQNQNDGFEFNVAVEEVPFNFKKNSKDDLYNSFKQKIESLTEEKLSRFLSLNIEKKLVNKDVIKAWSDCMDEREVNGSVIANKSIVDVTIKFRPKADNTPNPVVQAFDFSPLVPLNKLRIRPGVKIPIDGITQRFKRTVDDEILLSLDTSRGTWQGSIDNRNVVLKPDELNRLLVTFTVQSNFATIQLDLPAKFSFDKTVNRSIVGASGTLSFNEIQFNERTALSERQIIAEILSPLHEASIRVQTDEPHTNIFLETPEQPKISVADNSHLTLQLPISDNP